MAKTFGLQDVEIIGGLLLAAGALYVFNNNASVNKLTSATADVTESAANLVNAGVSGVGTLYDDTKTGLQALGEGIGEAGQDIANAWDSWTEDKPKPLPPLEHPLTQLGEYYTDPGTTYHPTQQGPADPGVTEIPTPAEIVTGAVANSPSSQQAANQTGQTPTVSPEAQALLNSWASYTTH